jgi:hypothetical protein
MAEEEKNFNEALSAEIAKGLEDSTFEKKYGGKYQGSEFQKSTYESLEKQDLLYKQYISNVYGSYDNFLSQKKLNTSLSVFDPTIHYMMDVTVVTDELSYKSDHISPDQVIMEALSGVCTIIFVDKDNNVQRLTGTLDRASIPTKELPTRASFFSPLPGDRIGIWDLNKQGWRSFYMAKTIKFIRDDTIGLE